MIKSLAIKNFRCFRSLEVNGLKRVNLIAGRNNVGKTAFLEAVWIQLGPGNPELALRLNAFRGLQFVPLEAEELWGWLFYKKHVDNAIELVNSDEAGNQRRLLIHLEQPKQSVVSPQKERQLTAKELTTAGRGQDLVLTYESQSTRTEARAVIEGNEITIRRAEVRPIEQGVFLQPGVGGVVEDIQRFSGLSRRRSIDPIVEALRLIEPRLKGLHVQVVGPGPVVYCDIEGMSEQVPLQMAGGGMRRLFSITCAIAANPNAVVMVDEIEVGLHHSVMRGFWRVIGALAEKASTQVFASTHSIECIRSAFEASQMEAGLDLQMIRLESVENEIAAVMYDHETLATSVDMNFEVR